MDSQLPNVVAPPAHFSRKLCMRAVYQARGPHQLLWWPALVMGGATPNIQKNVIAERLLGLPHDV